MSSDLIAQSFARQLTKLHGYDPSLKASNRRLMKRAVENIVLVAGLLREGNVDAEFLADTLDWAERDVQLVLDRVSEREAA